MKIYINIFRHILFVCLVLFSLNPCTVKKTLFHPEYTGYAKPLNKSKTTSLTGSCSYLQNEILQSPVVKNLKNQEHVEPAGIFYNRHWAINPAPVYNGYSKTSSGNSPPKYILYKRLKMDIA